MEAEFITGALGRGDYFLLFFFRIGAFLMGVPVFGLSLKRTAAKAAFAFLLAVILFPVCADPSWKSPEHLAAFFVLIVKESFVGFFLAFVAALSFGAVRIAGDLVGMEMGLTMAAQVDPITGASTPLIAYFYEVIAVVLFLGLNFHHWLFQALSLSFQVMPVGAMDFAQFTPEWLVGFFSKTFSAGLVLAAPVFVVMGMVSLTMGLLARAVPSFNVLDMGYSVRLGAAFGTMFLFLPGLISSIERIFGTMREALFGALRTLA